MCRKGYISTRPSLPGENKDCGQILQGMGYEASLLKPVNEGGDPDLAAVLVSSAQDEIDRKAEQERAKKEAEEEARKKEAEEKRRIQAEKEMEELKKLGIEVQKPVWTKLEVSWGVSQIQDNVGAGRALCQMLSKRVTTGGVLRDEAKTILAEILT